jgi:TonB family protein
MRAFWFTLRCRLCLVIVVVVAWGRTSSGQLVGESLAAQSPSVPIVSNSPQAPQAGQRPTLDLSQIQNTVRPAVFWITVFDSSGKLLRTETAFFISSDGKFVTTAGAIENGMNAVAKTADGGIYNVSGVLAASTIIDLAVLQADVKHVPFLTLNKSPKVEMGTRVGVVESALSGSAAAARETTISMHESDRFEVGVTLSPSSIGAPIVDANGDVVGVTISAGEKATARPSNSVGSLLEKITSDAKPRWPEVAQAAVTPTPTARATPKPRLVYAPAPSFPPGMSRPGISGTGRFRLTFDSKGNVTNVQVVSSTGNPYFDSSAIQTLRQWKSSPSQGWAVTVPVTFQTR